MELEKLWQEEAQREEVDMILRVELLSNVFRLIILSVGVWVSAMLLA